MHAPYDDDCDDELPLTTPKLSPGPLGPRVEGQSWIDWAMALYAHTLAELELDTQAWEATFGARHPGPGYTATMKAQERRLREEIIAHHKAEAARRA